MQRLNNHHLPERTRHGRVPHWFPNGGEAFPFTRISFSGVAFLQTTQIRIRLFRKRGSLSLLGLVVPSLSFCICAGANGRRSERRDNNQLTRSTTSAPLAEYQQPCTASVCLRVGLYDLLGNCSSSRLWAPAATRIRARCRPQSARLCPGSSSSSSTRLWAPTATRLCARCRPQSAHCPHRPRSNEYPRGDRAEFCSGHGIWLQGCRGGAVCNVGRTGRV